MEPVRSIVGDAPQDSEHARQVAPSPSEKGSVPLDG